jgi:hypothetical protein
LIRLSLIGGPSIGLIQSNWLACLLPVPLVVASGVPARGRNSAVAGVVPRKSDELLKLMSV